ncbi:Hpt domain-containing protein [Cryobacterium sp. PH31-L1]|uniref:Hpt domain-containing protein n=1 Tax=Cryobacterium sp. PH31-L1 TaxID=3046199 RepID=UPI0024BB9A7B|nr:Hpt domain-containing protein [Cryobacterium sp. PH31-L1]MDJ0376928.1 Hpt domain-containing protein [Cryobacterium sp. PH31-L1]
MSPLVDPAPLQRLRHDLGGDVTVQNRFVTDFLFLWNLRELRLQTALASADLEDADIVLLSIRSSSRMLGAVRLENAAGRLHSTLKSKDLAGCRQQLPHLSEVGLDTCLALSRHISA